MNNLSIIFKVCSLDMGLRVSLMKRALVVSCEWHATSSTLHYRVPQVVLSALILICVRMKLSNISSNYFLTTIASV